MRTTSATVDKPKCRAVKKDGSPCGRWPIKGATVCPKHGGSAPQVRKRAQERILAAADLAAARLIEFMNDKKVPYNVRLAATRDLLDRGLGTAAQTVKLGVEDPWADLLSELMDDEILTSRPQREIGPSHSRVGVEPDEDTTDEDNRTAAQYDPHEDDSRTTYNNKRTVRSKVIYADPTPEQAAAAATLGRRVRTAIFDTDDPDDRPTEYGYKGPTPPTDPTRPPQYVREAMDASGEEWRTGEGGGSRRADMGL